MKGLLFALALTMASGPAVYGQCPAPRAAADTAKPDIVLMARVQAGELRFDSQPASSLRVSGCPALDTTYRALRTNLPKPVQPGVTYRNVGIDFRMTARLTDLACPVADLLSSLGADSTAAAPFRMRCKQEQGM